MGSHSVTCHPTQVYVCVYLVSCVKCLCRYENVVSSDTVTLPTLTSVDSSSVHVSSSGSCAQRSSVRVCLVCRRCFLSSAFHAISRSLPRLFRVLPTLPGNNVVGAYQAYSNLFMKTSGWIAQYLVLGVALNNGSDYYPQSVGPLAWSSDSPLVRCTVYTAICLLCILLQSAHPCVPIACYWSAH